MRMSFLVACALAFGARVSDGDVIAAMAGHGWPNHFDSCFGSSWALMQNNCRGTVGAQRLLIIPTQARDPGWNNATVKASGNGFDTMTNCQGISAWTDGSGQFATNFTAIVSTSTSSSFQWLNLGAAPVWPAGTLHFECFVAQGGGRVASVDLW